MAWIELHQALTKHRKTYALADALHIEQYAAVGLVASLWLWAIDHAPDGGLALFPARAISDACGWRKSPTALLDALTTAGFLDADLTLHDWQDYAGRLIEQRAANVQRMRSARYTNRARTVPTTSENVAGLPYTTQPDSTEQDRTIPLKSPEGDAPNPRVAGADLLLVRAERARNGSKRKRDIDALKATQGRYTSGKYGAVVAARLEAEG